MSGVVIFICLALVAISFIWLAASLAVLEEDEDWRFDQPLAGSALPTAPTWRDLHRPFIFGPEPVEFETTLPPGEYLVALADTAPVHGGSLVIRNGSGHIIGENQWLPNPTSLGFSHYCGYSDFTGGMTNFSFTGYGRAVLLRLDPTDDLGDGSARVQVQGDFASSIPWSFMQMQREPTWRLNLRWSSASSVRIRILDEVFHVLAGSTGNSGGFELRSGKSYSIFYTIEGTDEVNIDIWFAPRSLPILPMILFAGSLVAVAILGFARMRKSARNPPLGQPKKSDERSGTA